MKILIVTGQKDLAVNIKTILKQEHHLVDMAFTRKSGIELSLTNDYQFILYEVNSNDSAMSIQKIRFKGINTPMIAMLTRDSESLKADSINNGCDDYVLLPKGVKELKLKMKAMLRRTSFRQVAYYNVTDMEFFVDKQMIRGTNEVAYLTKMESKLLEYLILNQNNILSKVQIAEHLWTNEVVISDNKIEVHISKVRNKLKIVTDTVVIETVRHVGYKCHVKH